MCEVPRASVHTDRWHAWGSLWAQRFFLGGLMLFLLGSTLGGCAPTLAWLLAGRVVQGVGAAALSTSSQGRN